MAYSPNTMPDGADVAEGTTTDLAVTSDSAGTTQGKLRGLVKILADVWDSINHRLNVQASNTGFQINRVSNVTALASAADTANGRTSNAAFSPNFPGVAILMDVTAVVGTAQINSVKLQGQMNSGRWIDVAIFNALPFPIATTGGYALLVYPAATRGGYSDVSPCAIPTAVRVVTVSTTDGTNKITYSVDLAWIL